MPDFIIPVLTILLGGVVSGMVTHRLETSRADRELRSQRLEQLYSAVHHFSSMFVSTTMVWSQVMMEKIDYGEALDMVVGITKDKSKDHETAVMLTNIYFPSLVKPLEDIFAQRDVCNSLQAAFKRKYQKEGPDQYQADWKAYSEASIKFDTVTDEFKKCLFHLARKT